MTDNSNGRTPDAQLPVNGEKLIRSQPRRPGAAVRDGTARGAAGSRPARVPALPVHLIICMRAVRRIDFVLSAVAQQHRQPDSLSISVDGEDPRIAELCRIHSSNTGCRVRLTQRRADGGMRLAQTRNNAVRTLFATGVKRGLLLFIDGDMILAAGVVGRHAAAAAPGSLLIGDRLNLTREQTQRLYATGVLPAAGELRAEQRRLRRMHRRAQCNIWLRRFGLSRAHTPNVTGAHLAVDVETFVRVNGFDERYQGHGSEDDDFARRAYAAGARPRSLILQAIAYRLSHDTLPHGYELINRSDPGFARAPSKAVCDAGLRTPLAQHSPRIQVL